MPIHYKFVKADGRAVTLAYIDYELCEYLHKPCDPERFSIEFQVLTTIGTTILVRVERDGRNEIVEADVDTYIEEDKELFPPDERLWLKKFLCVDYKFVAWYSR